MFEKYLDKLEYKVIIEKLEKNCKTEVGKTLAFNLKPYSNVNDVKKALDETDEALKLSQKSGIFPISNFDDFSMIFKRLDSNLSLSAKLLLDVSSLLKNADELKKYYSNSEFDLKILNDYFYNLYINNDIEKKISSSIISSSEIADTASSKLSSLRKNRKNLEIGIKNKLNTIIHSNSYSKYLMESVITIRNDRYVVPVKEEYKSFVKGFVHDVSSSGSTLYIEPLQVFDMNNEINNLIVEENKEIDRILDNLSSLLFPIVSFLKQDISIIGKLDFISSKVKLAIDYDCTKPELKDYIDLKGARHPLIDKEKVVPINIMLGKDFKTLVITGPNTGGKTVSLKTVGLLCLLAQSGLFIPAKENSCIKVFDNVFADIGDEQSIEESLSTFSAHIKNIVHILNNFTENSLILVDELGSGTDPIEGSALAISLLEYFYNHQALTIATTHYQEIKYYCINHKRI